MKYFEGWSVFRKWGHDKFMQSRETVDCLLTAVTDNLMLLRLYQTVCLSQCEQICAFLGVIELIYSNSNFFLCPNFSLLWEIQMIGGFWSSVVFPSFQAVGDFFWIFLGVSINVEDQLTRSSIKPAGYLIQMWLSIFRKCDFSLALCYVAQVQGNNILRGISLVVFSFGLFSSLWNLSSLLNPCQPLELDCFLI